MTDYMRLWEEQKVKCNAYLIGFENLSCEYITHQRYAHCKNQHNIPSFLTHYCGMVGTPTGITSMTDLINTDSIKEAEGSQEKVPAGSRADTQQHLHEAQKAPAGPSNSSRLPMLVTPI